jgi:PAS domain S-box-containing protein
MDRWPQALRVAVGICLNSRFPMFVWWGPELVNIYNDAYVPVLGKRHPAALGVPAQKTWHEIWPVVGLQADAVMKRGEATWNERVLLVMERHGYTEDTWFTWSYSPIPDDAGGIGGVFCACTEETPHVLAEADRDRLLKQLDTERSRLADVFRQSPSFLAVLRGPEHVFDFVNDQYYRLSGKRDLIGRTVRDALPEVAGQGYFEVLDRVYATGEPFVGTDMRVLFQRTPGAPREEAYMDFVYQPMLDAGGAVVGIMAHGVDVTERRRSEAAVREAQQRYRAVFESARDAMIIYTPQGTVVGANPAACRMYGYGPEEIVGVHAPDVIHPDARAMFAEFLRVAGAGGEYRCETVDRRRDGTAFPIEVIGTRFDYDGRTHLMSVIRDISERKRATDRVRRLHAVAAALSEALTVADVARVTVEQGVGALGATAGSLSLLTEDGSALEMAGHVGYPEDVIRNWQRYPLDAPIPLTDAVRTATPVYMASPEERVRRYPILASVRANEDTRASACVPLLVGGRAVGVLGLSFNHAGPFSAEDKEFVVSLTRQCAQALERARLFEAERRARAEAERASEAKSEFLATLSHELRTPLTPVLLTVSLMESHPGLPEDLREDVATIRRNVELESRLISDLLDLTRVAKGKLQLDTQDVDLHLILRAAIDICQREASARLSLDLRAARHMVRGDSTRLQQVFWNLINNAQKFTPPEGTITVRSSNAEGNRIRVEVTDTGSGIDAGLLPRLFNAFEQGEGRTAWQQAGLGLGLAISRKLAEAHGGTVSASSAGRGRGATFVVDLPVVEVFVPEFMPPARSQQLAGAAAGSGGDQPADQPAGDPPLAVLVVEDHEPTLRIMSKLLRGLGHRVTGASTVASATAAARQDGFDLIISDLGLPDGSGLDVMRQLRDRFEGRAIALTGYGMESDVAASRDAGFVEHITKPVDLNKLQLAIRRVTAPPAAADTSPPR